LNNSGWLKISAGDISRMAEEAFASRLVSIFDHFISAALGNNRAFKPALSNAEDREMESG
jgi:hypothetical protein